MLLSDWLPYLYICLQSGKKEVLTTITAHCLPKLICQLFSLQSRDHITDSERNLIALIGYAALAMIMS